MGYGRGGGSRRPYNAAMFRLTREIRFAVDDTPEGPAEPERAATASNRYAGWASLRGVGHYFALQTTLRGDLDPTSQYLVNIKRMDAVARERAVDALRACVAERAGCNAARRVAD